MDYRTDLAMEAYTLWRKDAGETTKLPGVIAREEDAGGVHITRVEIRYQPEAVFSLNEILNEQS